MIRQENLTKIYIKTAHSNSPEGWRFTSRQPMSSGATSSAGRAKKDWGRCWEGVVAMGVAWGMKLNTNTRPIATSPSGFHFRLLLTIYGAIPVS